MNSVKAAGDASNPVVTATVPEKFLRGMAARIDQSMPVGNEGAGVVVTAVVAAAGVVRVVATTVAEESHGEEKEEHPTRAADDRSEFCFWLFLDTTRNRSRQWCSMTSCGNREKARRHYQRQRAQRRTATA